MVNKNTYPYCQYWFFRMKLRLVCCNGHSFLWVWSSLTITVKPLLWDTSIQGTPPVREHQIWSRKHFHIIFVVVTVVPLLKGHLYSGERETLPGSRNPNLTSIQGIQRGIQKVTVHKSVNKFKCSLVTIATAFKTLTTLLKSMHCTCENSTHNIAEVS